MAEGALIRQTGDENGWAAATALHASAVFGLTYRKRDGKFADIVALFRCDESQEAIHDINPDDFADLQNISTWNFWFCGRGVARFTPDYADACPSRHTRRLTPVIRPSARLKSRSRQYFEGEATEVPYIPSLADLQI